jgi:cation diffusion facilitator family transporter
VADADSNHSSAIAVYGALAANLGIAAAKFVAAFFTGSSSMLSEGIHSLVDTANEGVLVIGVHRSRRGPDDLHQFGHGKEIYFWTLVVAVLLFAIGGGLAIYEGVTHLFDPHPIEDALTNYVVLGIALVLETASSVVAIRELDFPESGGLRRAVLETKDASVLAVIVENAAAITGLVIAALGLLAAQLTGDPRFDAIGSLAVGVVLVLVALFLAAESRALLIGESATGPLVDKARKLIEGDETVSGIESMRTMHLGPDHLVLTARVRFTAETADVVAAIVRIKSALRAADSLLDDVTIEPSPRQ